MRIDAHQHFWRFSPKEYPWINPRMAVLQRDFLPADLQAAWEECPLDGSIAVQARQSLEETRSLLQMAREHSSVKGVVGWVDLRSDRIEEELAEFANQSQLVGVRHVVQDEPDPRFLMQKLFLRGIALLERFGMAYDILIYPCQLPAAIELAARFPRQRFILDHLAKPSVRAQSFEPWNSQIRQLAQAKNVACKISGLVTEASWETWQQSDFDRYLEVALDCFGADRLMFGSDWPVCLVAASYQQVLEIALRFFSHLSSAAREKIFGGNAVAWYRLKT